MFNTCSSCGKEICNTLESETEAIDDEISVCAMINCGIFLILLQIRYTVKHLVLS